MTIPGAPNPPPPGDGPKAPPSRCMRSRNSWMRCCSSSSLPMPKSCVRPCAPLTLTDSVGPSAPAPFKGRLEMSPLFGLPFAPLKSPFPPPSEESVLSIARLWKPRPAAAMAAKALLDDSCWRDARISSASTLPAGFSGFSTTSRVNVAKPMNSIRTTYLPRAIPVRLNWPSEFVAARYFFPVKVFAAVTVTPGNEVLPLRADPVISKVTGACVGAGGVAGCGVEEGAVVDCGEGAGGTASCECKARGDKITDTMKIRIWRLLTFTSRTPRLIACWLGLRRIGFGISRRFGGSRRHAHFLHAFPLLRPDDHHHFRHEIVVLHPAADKNVIANLNIRHGHALAPLAQRSLFIQLERLCHIIRPQHGDLRRIHRLHLSKDEVFSKLAAAHHHQAAAGTARSGATGAVPGAPGNHQRG